MKKLLLIITIIASAVTADAKPKKPKFEVYNYPKGIELSDAYSVTVEGKDATVIPVNPGGKDVVCPPDSIAQRAKHGDEPHISLFGADKKVTVKVKFLKGAPKKVDVRPLAKGYEYQLKGDVLTLKLNTYDRVSVEADGDIWEPLFIFVNPVETEMLAEAKSNPQTRVFEAGKIHRARGMNFKGDYKNIYIQGGAIVEGDFYHRDDKQPPVKGGYVRGCGILDGRKKMGEISVFNIFHADGFVVENVTFLNRKHWSFRLNLCNNVTVDNVKVVAHCPFNDNWDENDGIHLIGCQDCTLSRCFAYSWDDAFNISTHFNNYGRETFGCKVIDAVAWNVAPGNCFQAGWTYPYPNHDQYFKDIYSIHSGTKLRKYYRGGVSIRNHGPSPAYNFHYENVYIEDPYEYGISLTSMGKKPGVIRDVTFKNVHIYKTPPMGCIIRGASEECKVQNVIFEDLFIEGKKINSMDDEGFKTTRIPSKYYDNIIFK